MEGTTAEERAKRYERNLQRRMQFARDNHCNTVVITGTGEPVLNQAFFMVFDKINEKLSSPFQWIELQTSGATLTGDHGKWLLGFLYNIGVSTISLSVANIFNSESNAEIMGTLPKLRFNLSDLCGEIKAHGFNLRLCLNMSNVYNDISPDMIFTAAEVLGADQLTFRELFATDKSSEQATWIEQHAYKPTAGSIHHYVVRNGRELEVLPFGAVRYSVRGISTVVDADCMSVKPKPVLRYLIVRENGKLYTKWDDEGSLLF